MRKINLVRVSLKTPSEQTSYVLLHVYKTHFWKIVKTTLLFFATMRHMNKKLKLKILLNFVIIKTKLTKLNLYNRF